MPKPGGMGGYIPPPSNLTLACIWALVFTWVRGEKVFEFWWRPFFFGPYLNSGKKESSKFGEDLFFWSSLNLFTWKNCGRSSSPQCWKQGKIGVKLQIIPPNAQQRSTPLAVNHLLVHSSPKNSLRSAKNVVFSLFCILVNRPIRGATAPPLATLLVSCQYFAAYCCRISTYVVYQFYFCKAIWMLLWPLSQMRWHLLVLSQGGYK